MKKNNVRRVAVLYTSINFVHLEGNTEEENNGYVVFKWNIHGSAEKVWVIQPEFLNFKEPKNRLQGTNSTGLCSLAGR